jgi:hypothetical protein
MEDWIKDAIRQMIVHCDLKMEQGYEPLSARSALYELGFTSTQALQVLEAIAAGGFDYCLDPSITMTGHHEAQGEKPSYEVCYWGPDQLKSRLLCLSNVSWHELRVA